MTINNYHKKSINKNKNCIKHEPNNYSPNNKIKSFKNHIEQKTNMEFLYETHKKKQQLQNCYIGYLNGKQN